PDAALLPEAAEGASAPGQAQPTAEGSVQLHHRPGSHFRVERLRHLQASAALLADRAVRRLRARPVLALRGRLALYRVHAPAYGAGLPGGPRVVASDHHRLVSGEVSQS